MTKKRLITKGFWWKLPLIVVSYLGVMLGIFFYAMNRVETKTASADYVGTTAKCLTYGVTTVDGERTAGCPSNFTIYMHGASISGTDTIYNGDLLNWSTYYFLVDVNKVSDHRTFELYKDGSLYYEKSVSGDNNLSYNLGRLPDGDYTLKYECRYAKNIFTAYTYYTYEYSFEVDSTKPTYVISAGTGTGNNSYFTNRNITYTATDPNLSYIRYKHGSDGEYKYSYGTSATVVANEANNGFWFFQAYDRLGNATAIVNRYIDTIAPVGSAYNQDEVVFANGSATNTPFIYTATDAGVVAKVEYKSPTVTTWTTYPGNVSILTSNGWYYFRAKDGAGNESDQFLIYYDTMNPTGCVYDAGGARNNGSITNKSYIKYVASDSGSGVSKAYVKKPGSSSFVSYTNNSQLTSEGTYYFKACDAAGNSTETTHEITLDLTAPVGQLKANGVNVASGNYTSKPFSYSATDAVGVAILQMKRSNSSSWETYTAGTAITGAEGWYSFRATDLAGNVSAESKIFYDKSKPTISLIKASSGASGQVVTSGSRVNTECIRATAVDTGSGIAYMRVWGTNYSTSAAYTLGAELTKEGRYYFEAVNKAGISSGTYEVWLDKTPAAGYLYAGGSYPTSDSVTNAAYICYEALDSYSDEVTCYVKKPGSTSFVEYEALAKLTEEGEYQFYSIDQAGNQSSTMKITIDRSIPTAQLYADGATITNGSYTNKQYIKFVSNGTCYVKKPGATSYSSYVSGTEFYQVGRYEFYAQNAAGTKTDTYVVIIDRTPKTVNLNRASSSAIGWNDIEVSWTDGDAKTTAPITRITVNGMPYVFGDIICSLAGNTYNIVVYDAAGNKSETKFSGGHLDLATITTQKEYWEVKDGWSEYVYSFHKYENALQYATSAEKRFVTLKTWNTATWDQGIPMDTKDSVNATNGNYYVYKSESDPEKQVAYFTQARLDEVVKKYAEKTIQHWYYWQKEPESCLDGDLNAYTSEKKIVGTEVELREGLIYTLDGVGYTDLTITEPGKHTLLIEDGYGGSVEYEIYILNSAPTMEYALGENSPSKAEFDRTYYFKDRVTVSIPFEGDEFAMFEVVNADTGESLGYFDIANACYIEESGSYTAVAYNHYGESKTFSFVISMNAPTITLTENAEKKTLDVAITESVDKESNITFLEIAKSDDDGETWIALTEDDYGKAITIETLEYHFRTSGLYKVTVMDEFRTGIDAITQTIEYKQPIPVGTLAGVEDKGYTNKTVTFTWKDEAVVILTKDGTAVEYKSGQKLTADGSYVLTFSNYDKYKKNYYFVIDTVAPEIALDGVENGGVVSGDVSATFESGATAELFKNGVAFGSYLGGTKITDDGEYRIVVKDNAGNESAVEFTIDKTVAWGININEQGLANSVTATANESVTVSLLKDGGEVEYTLGEEINLPGEYTLTLTDALGNTASRSFTIVQSIVKEFVYDFNRMPNFETVLISGEVRDTNYGILRLTEDAVYEIGVVAAGETYNFTVTVDATAPALILNGTENGGTTNNNVSITTTDANVQITVYLNGEEIEYVIGDVLTAEGEYRVVAVDHVDNSMEVSFTIDKTAPEIILNGVDNSGATNGNVSIQVIDGSLIVYLNDEVIEYRLDDELTAEGLYFVQAVDSVGNVTEASFTIDKSAPEILLKGVKNGGKTNSNVTITVSDDTTEIKVFLNGKEVAYKAGEGLKDEGNYKATVKDALGNTAEVMFTIDKTAATIVLNGVENGGSTKGNVTIGEPSENASFKVYFNEEEIAYAYGDILRDVGSYKVVVTDDCGNVAEYTFEIEKKISNAGIALISIGGVGLLGAIVFFVLKKKKVF